MTVDQSGKAMAKSTRNGTKKSPPGGGGGAGGGGGGAILTRFQCVGKLLYGKTKGIRSSKSRVIVIWSFYTIFYLYGGLLFSPANLKRSSAKKRGTS